MPGTLDRRHRRDRLAPFDAASLAKAAADLSRSYHEEEATPVDLSAACPSSMSRSSVDVEIGPLSVDSSSLNASISASNEVDVRHCPEKRTPEESAEVPADGGVDARDVSTSKIISKSTADGDGNLTQSRAAVARERRWCSDEADAGRRRRKYYVGDGVRRRRCRSLERHQPSTSATHLRCDAVTSSGDGDRTGELGFGGAMRKSDSFDSGIDTKSESTSPRSAVTDDVVEGRLNGPPDTASPPPDPSSSSRDVVPEVLSLTVAELDYDRKAAALVRWLVNGDAELRHVLTSSSSTYRTPTCYMHGVFDTVVRPLSSNLDEVDECSKVSVSDDTSTEELKVGSLFPTLDATLNVNDHTYETRPSVSRFPSATESFRLRHTFG